MTLFDRNEFVGKFVQEARENLEALDRGMVGLEKSPEDGELLTELMRAAHTLKGSSRMLNYMDVNQVAHRTEDVLEGIRDGQVVMSAEVGDILFMALDEIGTCIEAIAQGGEGDRDVSGLCRALEELGAGGETEPDLETVAAPVTRVGAESSVEAESSVASESSTEAESTAELDTSEFVGSFV